MQRDRDMLVGQLVPAENTDWSESAAVQQVVGEETSEIGRYLKYKVTDVAVAALAWYRQAKKQMLRWHKQTGILMLVALVFRAIFRMQSGIPPRFPGNKLVQLIETQGLRAFYAFALLLPTSASSSGHRAPTRPARQRTIAGTTVSPSSPSTPTRCWARCCSTSGCPSTWDTPASTTTPRAGASFARSLPSFKMQPSSLDRRTERTASVRLGE